MKDIKIGDVVFSKSNRSMKLQKGVVVAKKGPIILIKYDNKVGHSVGSNCGYCRNFNISIEDPEERYYQVYEGNIYERKVKRTKIAEAIHKDKIIYKDDENLWIVPE